LKSIRLAIVAVAGSLILGLGLQGQALAQTAVCSPTTVPIGRSVLVTGQGFAPSTAVRLFIDGQQLAAGQTNSFGGYSLSGVIPVGTPLGPNVLTVFGTVLGAAPTLTATNTSTGCSVNVTAATAATPTPRPAPRGGDNRPGGQQQQQQQQQQLLGAADGNKLPKTGVDAAEVGGLGSASLLAGAGLVQYARRRRSHWLPMTAAEAMATPAIVTEPEPVIATASEVDLLLPYEADPAIDTPPAPGPVDPITPTF
jgi:LPXTG-motif cell wall-anchored protein